MWIQEARKRGLLMGCSFFVFFSWSDSAEFKFPQVSFPSVKQSNFDGFKDLKFCLVISCFLYSVCFDKYIELTIGRQDGAQKVKPLTAAPCLLRVSRWDIGRTQQSNNTSNNCFPKMIYIYIILGTRIIPIRFSFRCTQQHSYWLQQHQ